MEMIQSKMITYPHCKETINLGENKISKKRKIHQDHLYRQYIDAEEANEFNKKMYLNSSK